LVKTAHWSPQNHSYREDYFYGNQQKKPLSHNPLQSGVRQRANRCWIGYRQLVASSRPAPTKKACGSLCGSVVEMREGGWAGRGGIAAALALLELRFDCQKKGTGSLRR